MSQDCIFCKIVAGDIPCARLYETETVLSFLDIMPVNPGHALVIPKAHHATVWDIPQDLAGDLLAAVQRVSRAVKDATGAGGINLMMNNLEVAGQLVPHAHFHIIPRHGEDGLKLWPQTSYPDEEDMNRLAEAVRKRLG